MHSGWYKATAIQSVYQGLLLIYTGKLGPWDRETGSRHNQGCSKVQFWELENGSGPLRLLHISSSSWAWKPGHGVGNACWALQEPDIWYQKPDSIRSMWGARKY